MLNNENVFINIRNIVYFYIAIIIFMCYTNNDNNFIIFERILKMSNLFGYLKKGYIFSSILYIIAGIFLIIFSQTVTNVIWYIFASALIIFGIIKIINYFTGSARENLFRFSLVIGIIMIALVIYIFAAVDMFIKFLPFIFGFIILISALVKLQQSIDLCRNGYKNWWTIFVRAIILGVFAALVLFNLGAAAGLPVIFVGISLIFNGITDIWAFSRLNKITKNIDNDSDTVVINNDDE